MCKGMGHSPFMGSARMDTVLVHTCQITEESFGFSQSTFQLLPSPSSWTDVELVSTFAAFIGVTRRRRYNRTRVVAEINGTQSSSIRVRVVCLVPVALHWS